MYEDSPGMVTCRPTLLASTISGPMSLSLGAPIRRRFISNSSCVTGPLVSTVQHTMTSSLNAP